MTNKPAPADQRTKFRGSLTGALVRTLLLFTFIPLSIMAGVAYFRARSLLREQAELQSQNLLTNQIKLIEREIEQKENLLLSEIRNDDFKALIELGLHVNPMSDQFIVVQDDFISEFQKINLRDGAAVFDQFFLVDNKGNIKIASNPSWQGLQIDPDALPSTSSEFNSSTKLDLVPLYTGEFIVVTSIDYETSGGGSLLGSLVGITEKDNLADLMQPLSGISPLASIYFVLPDQRFVSSNPNSQEFAQASDLPSQEAILSNLEQLKLQENETPKSLETISADGGEAFAQLQWFPSLQAGIVLEVKADQIYGQIASLAPFTILLAAATLAATGVVISLGVNRIIKPIRSLSEITSRFAAGDWQQRAEVRSHDEVGMLADSFNNMADELSESYRTLEQKVEERTRQIRTAAEVAQNITTITNLNDMLNKTTELLISQFNFYQASIFLMDRDGLNLYFKAGKGPATAGLTQTKYRLPVGSASMIGWVGANNTARVASDILEDPLHLQNEFLPETRSEACVPISIGNLVLGVLDVQSDKPGEFSSQETLIMLRTLASQVAASIQAIALVDTSQVNFEELERLYRSSHLIATAESAEDIIEISGHILKASPFPVIMFRPEGNQLWILSSADSANGLETIPELPEAVKIDLQALEDFLANGPIILTSRNENEAPAPILELLKKLNCRSAAILPVRNKGLLSTLILFGSRRQTLSTPVMQPYISMADLMSVSMEKAEAIEQTGKHLREVESLASINELISETFDLDLFFRGLLGKIHQIIGKYSLTVALYDDHSKTISIPFSYEDDLITSIEPFPLGEGLTSILINTRQPLVLVEDVENKARELGAKISGRLPRSWMGAPMFVQNTTIGALIVQDPEKEYAFSTEDLKFFTTLAGQAAGVIHNAQLINESRQKAVQLETAAEIARDISGSLNLDELLIKSVSYIRERFEFYHAAIFLRDTSGEYMVIREASGDAGIQMKRNGHKMAVGSKSIVGYVSSHGTELVVNDTARDATYYANPLLPETRSEAAVPLKVGERILGVLDIQSTHGYAFSEDNIRSLRILADQLAIAVVNTELFAETQEHLSQHRLLHHVTTTAASGTTLEEALDSTVKGLQVTLGGDRVAILLLDRQKNQLAIEAAVGYAENVYGLVVPVGSGVVGWAAAHRRPLRVGDVQTDPRYIQVSPNTRSELAIPLIFRNELLGVLNVESEQADDYTETDEEMLGTLGGSLAAIIANARLLEQIRLQADRERVVFEAIGNIRKASDIQSILMTTASELARVTGARYARIEIQPDAKKQAEEGS